LNGNGATHLVVTTSNTSFRWPQPLRGGTTPLPIVHYVPLHGDYIQMSLFPKTFKWESQNWDSCCPKILDVHIFFKSNLKKNKMRYQYLIALKTRKFQWCKTRLNWSSFDLCFQRIYGRESNSQFDSRPFFRS
jgi:hypothetical protein